MQMRRRRRWMEFRMIILNILKPKCKK